MQPPEDVAASGLNPLQQYLEAGAAELRDPHPQFDAVYYAQRHLDAAVNPLLYHLRVPQSLGHKRRVQILQSVMRRPAWPEAA